MSRAGFEKDLAWSRAAIRGADFQAALLRHFEAGSRVEVLTDATADRHGIDCVVVSPAGVRSAVDAKISERDYASSRRANAFLVEVWSDEARRVPGWARQNLHCEFVFWFHRDTGRSHLASFGPLRRAVEANWERWARPEVYGPMLSTGKNNTGYRTAFLMVPRAELERAMEPVTDPAQGNLF